MFYSQFILAKKGPLGTIWIAAHLERKLRKNQVADTDIGVSVDSIIFPDVPIALRLSSHLLLGVVRIYSRKVGYLFDDCSEALLKVRQAFRSAAVDLPPEESTAPYHSITLPETFDLDDFELPDSGIFQGNYVDHHVSSKEQITLQDTMDGVVYSTSQFGPDERFGDGDTCQILDLNEDSLLAGTPMIDGTFDDGPQTSLPPMTPLETDDNNDCGTSDGLKTLLENNNGDQVEVLDPKPESSEYAEAPATPMLVEEANFSSAQDALVYEANNTHGVTEVKLAESKDHSEPAAECLEHVSANGSLPSSSCPEAERPILSASLCPNGVVEVLETAEGIQNGIDSTEEKLEERLDENAAPSSYSPVSLELEKDYPAMADGPVKEDSPQKLSEDGVCQLGSHHSPGVADGAEVHEELKDHETSSLFQKDVQSKFMKGLQLCNSNVSNRDKSLLEGDEQLPSADVTEVTLDGNQTLEPALNGKVQAHAGELLDQFYSEANLDLPAPETLLSASGFSADKPNDLLVESTPNKEGLEEGTKQISGRKRSFTESVATIPSNSLESFGLSLSKRTIESVPDDDDLLSSILVGRKSSVLKLKSTPAPLEIVSSKRPRNAQRATASKRKVPMDETMVLLGDMIRQQLMSTEDLRRTRKKAPCTLSEISMLQRQFLEDEIFSEPTLAGLSTELSYMHKETYDVSATKICKLENAIAPAEATKDSSLLTDVIGESEKGVSYGPLLIRDDGEVQAVETLPGDRTHQDEEFATDAHITEAGMLVDKMEVDERGTEGADGASQSVVSEIDMQAATDPIPEDRCNLPGNFAAEPNLIENMGDNDTSLVSPGDILNEQRLDKDSSEPNVLTEGADLVSELLGHDLLVEAGPHSGIGGPVDVGISFPMENCIVPGDHGDIPSGAVPEAPEQNDVMMPVEDIEDAERFGKSSVDVVHEADFQNSSVAKDDFGYSIEHEGDANYASAIDDEGARLHEDLEGRDMEARDDHDDLGSMAFGNDTEFLNVDDDEVDEDNEHLSDGEDARLLDNSGWSSRTRAVGKYLQTLFDKEAVRGKSVVPMDSLLAGKTRKEASRMFFESLVLKTRDYIQVEQGKPFENINLKPRSKLMKSQF